MHVVLVTPEIPPNTGNVARLCAALDVPLHLVEPLGFSLSDRYLKRAGLDYWPHVRVSVWPDFAAYRNNAGEGRRLVMTSSRAGEKLHRFSFQPEDALVFGPETRGLPEEVLALSPLRVRIPIRGVVRSLNLSTAAGIALHQALAVTGALDFLP
jgi:tRNA (cytidine/uridine-2'-O-)-methyltransferase